MIHLVLAFALMGLYAYSTVALCVVTWSVAAVAAVVLFFAFGVIGLVAFVVASFSDPGYRVDLLWDSIKPAAGLLEQQQADCDKCQDVKPPRAHHCSVCKRCVFRYDHHCKWINNCVGQLNHKPFVLAVVYFWVCAAVVVTMHAWRFSLASPLLVFDLASLIIFSVTSFCILVHFASLTVMAVMQVGLLLLGRTQVEQRCCKGRVYGCHFDRGWYTNVAVVFGPNPWLWLLPLPRYDVAALSYEAFTPSIAPPEPMPISSLLDASAAGESDPLLRGDASFSGGAAGGGSGAGGANSQSSAGGSGSSQSISGGVALAANPLRWMENANSFEGGAFDWVEKDGGDAVN